MVNYDKEELIQFIEENKLLILDLDFDELYSRFRVDHFDNELTQFLVDCNINPLDHVTRLFDNMFEAVTLPVLLQYLKIPKGVKVIPESAFENCTSIKDINLPNGLKEIDYCAFTGCTSIERLRIPGSVKYVGPHAFEGCTGLKTIYIRKNLSLYKANVPPGCKVYCCVTEERK